MSITQQEYDLREVIHRKIEKRLQEHPEEAFDMAMSTARRLSRKMTLKELRQWHTTLYLRFS